jgi:hypothetical protein
MTNRILSRANLYIMWIAYPVVELDKSVGGVWSKVREDFFRSAPDISRSFSVYGRPGRSVATSFRLRVSTAAVLDGHLYSIRGIGSVAVLKFAENAPKSLARPNVNSTANMLNGLGLIPTAKLITETVVFASASSRVKEFRFGITSQKSEEYIDDELFPRFLAAIVVERMMLDLAIESLTSSFVSARRARRLMANLKFWISRPAIESARLRESFHALRDALDLDKRSAEIVEALSEIVKRGNASFISGSATTATLLALTNVPQIGHSFGQFWPVIAVAGGLAVWLFVRGFRI